MPDDRDVQAFDERSSRYEGGWLGTLHHRIADRTLEMALNKVPAPKRVLDVGCGTGYLLRQLAVRCPDALQLVGVDPAPGMIEVATAAAEKEGRLQFSTGVAEHLEYPDRTFDLVVSTTSFDHWTDQEAGLMECARVMAPNAYLVLTDLFSAMLLPTLVIGHRDRARTIRRANALLVAAGFRSITWRNLSGITSLAGVLIRAVTADHVEPAAQFGRPGGPCGRLRPSRHLARATVEHLEQRRPHS